MKQFNLKSLASLLILMVVGIAAYSAMDAFSATNVVLGVGSVVAGGTVTQQSVTGGDNPSGTSEYLDMRDVERQVDVYKPYQTPLLTILSQKSKGDPVESWEAKYYAVDARAMKTTITAASAINSGVTTLTVSDASLFTKYNTVFVPSLSGATKVNAGVFVVGMVIGFPASNQLAVKILNPAAALAAADFADKAIYRGGSAHNETAASTTPWGIIPDTDSNYVQIFMEQVEQSEYQKLMKKEADWGFSDLKRMAIEDFKIQRERTFLAGIKSETNVTVDGRSMRFYTCGGILNDTNIPVNSTFNLSNFEASPNLLVPVLKDAFTGNNGSKERWMLLGADFTESMEKANFTDKEIKAKETEVVAGLKVTKIVSTFGTLNLMYYEQLDLLGMEKSALIIDPANIHVKDLKGKGFNVRPIDYKTSGVASVDAAVIEQASTLLIKNKSTHLVINAVA